MDQINMFSLLTSVGRRELTFDELAAMPGRKIELIFQTAKREWSLLARVVRVQGDNTRRVLVYQTDDAGYGLINGYEFSDSIAYPVRAYEVS